MKRFFTIILFLIISSSVLAQTYTVERVIDGDTLKLTNGERVRLIGIDTPESQPNDKAKRDSERTGQDLETINKMGQEATNFMNLIVRKGMKVELDFDVQERDKYGRLLAYVFYLNYNGPVGVGYYFDENYRFFVNASIVGAGYATPMTIPPNVKYADLFQELYEEAREERRGLWK